MEKFKTCPVCGGKFKICAVCQNSSAPSWKKHSDSFEHYDIYVTVILYTRHEISREEAAERLSGYSLKGYRASVQKYIDEIFLTDEVATNSEEEVDAAPDVDAVDGEAGIVEANDVEVKPTKKRRRKKDVEAVFGQDETQ